MRRGDVDAFLDRNRSEPGNRAHLWSGQADNDGQPLDRIPAPAPIDCGGKYRPLWLWLRANEQRERTVSFSELEATGTWRDKLVALFGDCRRVLLDHPAWHPCACPARRRLRAWLASTTESSRPCPRAASTTPRRCVRLRPAVDVPVCSVLWQIPRADTERERLICVAVAHPDRTPRLVQHAGQLGRRDPKHYFEHGLETIIAGL